MPEGFTPDEGQPTQQLYITKHAISGVLPWTLILWVNNFTPDENVVLADLTEASFTGYSQITMDRADWSDPVKVGDRWEQTWGAVPLVYQCTDSSAETIYGYAYIDLLAGIIMFCQRLEPGDVTLMNLGTVFTLVPPYQTKSPIA